jgi:hypothetical protein
MVVRRHCDAASLRIPPPPVGPEPLRAAVGIGIKTHDRLQ